MLPLFILFTLVLCGSGLLQDDWAAFENILRALEISKREAITGSTLIGCFKDNWDSAMAEPFVHSSKEMTLKMCLDRCRSRGKRYFAVHSANSCSCGNDNAAYYKYGVGTGCDTPCSGNSAEKCGGTWRNSVYEIDARGEYIGCYTNATAETSHFYSDKMTVKMCYDHCKEVKKSYFALNNGALCYCGGDDAISTKWTSKSTGCDIPCPGDSSKKCGGLKPNSVYKIPVQRDDGYVGCYKDTADSALPDLSPSSLNDMTLEKCSDSCKSKMTGKGKSYYALQFGKICFCADATAAYDQYGPGTQCNVPCPGNSQQVCGGPWHNSVYQIQM